MYWVLIKKKQEKAIITVKLSQIYNLQEQDWENVFKAPSVVRETKLQAFQYKILFNLIPCNLYLKRIKRSDTDQCDTCKRLDDLPHYLNECDQTKIFWNNLKTWWKSVTNEEINITEKEVIIGLIHNYKKNETINACIILAKWHIYKNKLADTSIFFYKYLCELKYFCNDRKNNCNKAK
jgi:hypothetical protein